MDCLGWFPFRVLSFVQLGETVCLLCFLNIFITTNFYALSTCSRLDYLMSEQRNILNWCFLLLVSRFYGVSVVKEDLRSFLFNSKEGRHFLIDREYSFIYTIISNLSIEINGRTVTAFGQIVFLSLIVIGHNLCLYKIDNVLVKMIYEFLLIFFNLNLITILFILIYRCLCYRWLIRRMYLNPLFSIIWVTIQ